MPGKPFTFENLNEEETTLFMESIRHNNPEILTHLLIVIIICTILGFLIGGWLMAIIFFGISLVICMFYFFRETRLHKQAGERIQKYKKEHPESRLN